MHVKIKKLWVFAIFILIYVMANMAGIYIKKSDDWEVFAVSVPISLSLDVLTGTHQVEIFVIQQEGGEFKNRKISLERRRDLKGFYFEKDSHNLWVDGDGGILCYQEIGNKWDEFALVESEKKMFLVDTKNTNRSKEIEYSKIPLQIKKRYIVTINESE